MNNHKYLLLLILALLVIFPASSSADDSPSWPKVYWQGPSTGNYIALTFDDAPSDDLPELLDILDELDIKATFFVEGSFASQRIDLLHEIHDRGHELGNHTYTHPNLANVDENTVRDELYYTNSLIYRELGIVPHLFRPPGGHRNATTDYYAYGMGMMTVMWTVNTGDVTSSESQIRQKILNRVDGGGIILMHDGLEKSRNVLPGVVETLRRRGYTFVTVGEMIELTCGQCPWPDDRDPSEFSGV